MDREKAIQILKRCEAESYCSHYKQKYNCIGCGQREALDLAIEALGQTESEDCISKHDLWRIIEDNAYWITYNETSKEKGMTLTGINQALNECPPVTPTVSEDCISKKVISDSLIHRISKWIPVSERLPEEYDQYLCYCEGGYCYVYWLENKPWAETTVKEEEIIAWMPLPEPYKGGDDE